MLKIKFKNSLLKYAQLWRCSQPPPLLPPSPHSITKDRPHTKVTTLILGNHLRYVLVFVYGLVFGKFYTHVKT